MKWKKIISATGMHKGLHLEQGLFKMFLGPTQKHMLEALSMHTVDLTMKAEHCKNLHTKYV
jgi:hypothetical protein